jgi:hypothetical protein
MGVTDDAPNLRSLSPAYVPDQHEGYVNILNAKLAETGPDAPRNIALTGHYGSGKSSVLLETQRALEKDDVKVINLSLPSLGIGDGRIPKDGDKALDRTNLIQKEIVKQLLYRRKPSDMPASRYSRLDTFHVGRALRTAVGIGVAVTGVALLAKVPNKVRESSPPNAWTWINNHLWGDTAGPFQWLSLLVVFVLTVWAVLWAQRLLQQQLRVTELAAGPTKVTLSDSSSSYFDEYLDEIVYFFQTSKTAVVIFEDLDRFKDPHIFETLRELNLLLNNAEQTGATPIRFVYAIRDGIFEQLDIEVMAPEDGGNGDGSSADQGEARRLMSTNRTKFFDLVVPMVPFISHRTSRDLIRNELEAIVPEQRPDNAVVDIVGAHLTDMRLIKNICNEYEVFRRRILRAGGLEELTADRLFASIVYKNLYLADYEKIRDGTSRLDTLYHAYRDWAAQQTAAARSTERTARDRLRRIDAIGPRAARLGARLQKVLRACYVPNPHTETPQVQVAGTTHNWTSLTSEVFWRAYLQDRGDIKVHYQPGYQPAVISFVKVQTLMGYQLAPDDWTDEAKAESNSEIAAAVADQRTIQHASMTDALGDTHKQFLYEGEERSIADVAENLFDGASLVLELLRAGLIDENFTLYITQFPGQAISASAMNFIIKAVQPDALDIDYHFGAGEEANTNDIKAVLDAEAGRLLGGQSVYNIQIFDYLLTEDPGKLNEPVRRLAANAANDRDFINAYLTSGKATTILVQRLSASWSGIFDYLIGDGPEVPNQDLLDAALGGVHPQLTYAVTAGQRNAIAAALPHLATVTTPQSVERATAVAKTIEQIGIRIQDLAVLAEPLRSEFSTRSLYPVTLVNLREILGSDEHLPLDYIKDARATDVYAHVLAHLHDYLAALDAAPDIPTIANADQYADLLADVGAANAEALVEVARRADTQCTLNDLDGVDAALWPSVASARRLALTAQNVAAYMAEHGVDEPLAEWLSVAGAIRVDQGDATPVEPLALKILNAKAIHDSAKSGLVDTLGLESGSIPAASLDANAHALLPSLVKNGLVEDNSDSYTILRDDEWEIKEALISVSVAFPAYMISLALSGDELLSIASRPVPEAVKLVLLEELDTFKDNLGPRGAAALAGWAANSGHTPAAEAIVTMATKGGAGSAASIVKLLADQAGTIDLELLKDALNSLGKPYDQLTAPGWDRPKVEIADGIAAVLDRLQKAGVVSKFVENPRRRVFEISKRRS